VDFTTGKSVPNTLASMVAAHPDWIVYACDAQGTPTAPAWEYGDAPSTAASPAYIPLDITNPAVRDYMWNHYYKRSLDTGFPSLFFDNLSLHNFAHRCGHYDTSGNWIPMYSGTPAQQASQYKAQVLDWLRYLRDKIHAYSPTALLEVNYNPADGGDLATDYVQVYDIVDVVWNEAGFTDWGTKFASTQSGFQATLQADLAMSGRSDKALIVNALVLPPGDTMNYTKVTPAQRLWAVGTYLLVKGAHTYTAVTTAEYGYFVDYPEYHINIGAPVDVAHQSQGAYVRTFTGGLVLVNPDAQKSITVQMTPGLYRGTDGAPVSSVVLPPTSASILVLYTQTTSATPTTNPTPPTTGAPPARRSRGRRTSAGGGAANSRHHRRRHRRHKRRFHRVSARL
jgi:hypothetical protein